MNAVLAIIADGGPVIVVFYREAVEIIQFLIILRWRPCPTPSVEAPGDGVYSSMETMLLDGKTAHHGGDVCMMCVLLEKSLPSVSFLFTPERT